MKFEYINSSLFLLDGEKGTRFEVDLKPCFPWEKPREHLSVRDDEGKEHGMVSQLGQLDRKSKSAVEHYLNSTRFIIKIDKVVEVIEDVELRKFTVNSNGQERVFFMELDDWPELKADGSIVMVDLAGDVYQVESLRDLSRESVEHLTPYLY